MTVDELKSINNLKSNLLSIGQRLKIKESNDNQNIYIVKKGDTLYKIANMYGTTVDNLKALNNLKNNNLIQISPNGIISLTDEGYQIANKIYQRHLLLTEFFVKLGVREETAKIDACKIEHDISEETFHAIINHIKK